MSPDKKKAAKILKIKIRKTLYRARKYIVGLTALGAVASTPSKIDAQNQSSDRTPLKPDTSAVIANHALFGDNGNTSDFIAYNRMVEVDISTEVAQRAEWVVDEFLKATSKHLREIKQAAAKGQKATYVRNNFFNVVHPRGGLSGRTDYCITAINRALIDANSCGDLDHALPKARTEGNNSVECNRFVAHLTQRGFGNCIKRGRINVNELEVGDIIMTPRGGGHYHATTYIGKGRVRSFNNDGEWPLQKQTGIVIKIRDMTQKAIMMELQHQNLIQIEKGNKQVIPLQDAQKMMKILYNKRPLNDMAAEHIHAGKLYAKQPGIPKNLLTANTTAKNISMARRNTYEI